MECLQKPLAFWVGKTDHKCWMFRDCLKIHPVIKNRLWEKEYPSLPLLEEVYWFIWFKCNHFLKGRWGILYLFIYLLVKEKIKEVVFVFFPPLGARIWDCVGFELCKLCFIHAWIPVGHLLPPCTHRQIIFRTWGNNKQKNKHLTTLLQMHADFFTSPLKKNYHNSLGLPPSPASSLSS